MRALTTYLPMPNAPRLHLHFDHTAAGDFPRLLWTEYTTGEDTTLRANDKHHPGEGGGPFDWTRRALQGYVALVLLQAAETASRSGRAAELTDPTLARETYHNIRRGFGTDVRCFWPQMIFGLDNTLKAGQAREFFLWRTSPRPALLLGSKMLATNVVVTRATAGAEIPVVTLNPEQCGHLAQQIISGTKSLELRIEVAKNVTTNASPSAPVKWQDTAQKGVLPLSPADLFRIHANVRIPKSRPLYLYLIWLGGERGKAVLLHPRTQGERDLFPVTDINQEGCTTLSSPDPAMLPTRKGWPASVQRLATENFLLVASEQPIPREKLFKQFEGIQTGFPIICRESHQAEEISFPPPPGPDADERDERDPLDDPFAMHPLDQLGHELGSRLYSIGARRICGLSLPIRPAGSAN